MSVFQQAIGPEFARLSPTLQRIHDSRTRVKLIGRCDIDRGRGLSIATLARMATLPPSGVDVPTSVVITRDAQGECWSRKFGDHEMRSRLWAKDGLLHERLGTLTLSFRLLAMRDRIDWRVVGASAVGVPLPTSWFAGLNATEAAVDGDYRFDVRAQLPRYGLVVHYRGTLEERE
jgi:hypothetical protein